MEYHAVFDVSRAGVPMIFPLYGIVFVALAAVFVVIRRWLRPKKLQFMPIVMAGFGILWTIIAFAITWSNFYKLTTALRQGQCTVTEGAIEDFSPMSVTGKGFESFSVHGKGFQYSPYVMSAGFRETQAQGSPLRDGIYVRIYHLGNDIARLEIRGASNVMGGAKS